MKLGSLKATAKSYLQQYEQKGSATYAAALQAIGGLLIIDGFTGIDNPFGEKKRQGIFGALAGVGFGVLFMFIPHIFGTISGIKDMTASTSASVVSVSAPRTTQSSDGSSSTTCSIKASYTVDGKQYSSGSSSSSSDQCNLAAGQTVTIDYNPNNPASWAYGAKTATSFMGIFFWAGVLVAVASLVTVVIRLLSIIFGWKLLRKGRALAATLPADTSFNTIVNEIRQDFAKTLFNFGGMSGVFNQPTASQPQFTVNMQSPLGNSVQSSVPVQSAVGQTQSMVPAQPVSATPQQVVTADPAPAQPVASVMQPVPATAVPAASPAVQPIMPQQPVPAPVPQMAPVQPPQPPQQPQGPLQ
jgi:hypothetical protein